MHRRGRKRIRMDQDDSIPSDSSEHETDMIVADAYDDDNANGVQASDHDSQDNDSSLSDVGNMRIAKNTRATKLQGGLIQQPKHKEIDDDLISTTSSTSKPRGGGRGRSKGIQVAYHPENTESLYYAIYNNKLSLKHIVDKWIKQYKTDKKNALLMLMQFFIDASGCKSLITPEMQSLELGHIIRKMTEGFDKEKSGYPLINKGRQDKKFKLNFCEFMQILVHQCQYSIIYDESFMDNIISLLTGLSDSQVRAFRYTSTLAAIKLMTALVDVALTLSINLDNIQRQYEVEYQNARKKRVLDRLESLISKEKELEKNMNEIQNLLTYIFMSVFIHRYRDTLPEIRAICITEIGVWMEKLHQIFLNDSHLKYIGWTLYDEVGEVRLTCLQTLQPLYASEELKTKLEEFTKKFKDRIVAMTLDKEYDVAVQAVKLVISIYKHHRKYLNDKDYQHVYGLIYSLRRAVAQAAGEFVNEIFFTINQEIEVKTKSGKKRLPNTPLIKDLVVFYMESDLNEYGAYLVDSLMETNKMMKDWECMTDLLLEEPHPNEEILDSQEETSLIEIMVCCIKQAATGEAPVGRVPTRKVLSAKEVKQVQEDKQKLTEHFIEALPLLLDKYRTDFEKLANLLSIPQYFELDIYTKQEQNLDSLLRKIHDIVAQSSDIEVLNTAAKTLEYMCLPGSAIFTKCEMARSTLIDAIVIKYRDAISDVRNLIDENYQVNPSDDIFKTVKESLKKVAAFYSCHDMNSCDIWNSLFKDIKEFRNGLPDEAVKYCISACFFSIIWSQHDLIESADCDNTVDEKCERLKHRLHEFMECMSYFISPDEVDVPIIISEEAYNTASDLLIIFCSNLNTQKNPLLHQLIYDPDQNMQDVLNKFIQQYVFSNKEERECDKHSKFEELHKKRNFLAAYCKLIFYNIIPTMAAADVFKHYFKYNDEYGDIIKMTISKARDINKTNCALTMQHSLNILYNEMSEKKGSVTWDGKEFASIKKLAEKFALFFGTDAVKNREAITALHRRGILFAVSSPGAAFLTLEPKLMIPPANLSYLEILSEFTHKLLSQDKSVVLSFLDKHLQVNIPTFEGEEVEHWLPLHLYRNGLLPVTRKRAYGKRKKDQIVEEEEADDVDDGSDDDFM